VAAGATHPLPPSAVLNATRTRTANTGRGSKTWTPSVAHSSRSCESVECARMHATNASTPSLDIAAPATHSTATYHPRPPSNAQSPLGELSDAATQPCHKSSAYIATCVRRRAVALSLNRAALLFCSVCDRACVCAWIEAMQRVNFQVQHGHHDTCPPLTRALCSTASLAFRATRSPNPNRVSGSRTGGPAPPPSIPPGQCLLPLGSAPPPSPHPPL
jgi:hypothetical protein